MKVYCYYCLYHNSYYYIEFYALLLSDRKHSRVKKPPVLDQIYPAGPPNTLSMYHLHSKIPYLYNKNGIQLDIMSMHIF